MATQVQVTVERHEGRWYVSPVRSVTDSLVSRLTLIPDGATFEALATDEDGTGPLLLFPFDLFGLVSGYPFSSTAMFLAIDAYGFPGEDDEDWNSVGWEIDPDCPECIPPSTTDPESFRDTTLPETFPEPMPEMTETTAIPGTEQSSTTVTTYPPTTVPPGLGD